MTELPEWIVTLIGRLTLEREVAMQERDAAVATLREWTANAPAPDAPTAT